MVIDIDNPGVLLEPPSVALLEASLLMWGLCRSAPSALRVSFASKSITQFRRRAPAP
jgi:hypothetical protein